MPNRVNSTTGERAWSEGEQLLSGTFLSGDVSAYWIEAYVRPTKAQRDAGRKRNIPVSVPINADWSATRVRREVAKAKAGARAKEVYEIDTNESYNQIAAEDAADYLDVEQ